MDISDDPIRFLVTHPTAGAYTHPAVFDSPIGAAQDHEERCERGLSALPRLEWQRSNLGLSRRDGIIGLHLCKVAPRFTDRFRVLALTLHGHGDSEYPESGYDPVTLVEDIRQFMDVFHIEKAIFAGHSLAGVEWTHFAATHPERVKKLIYLEALDDRRKEQEIIAQHPLNNVKIKKEETPPPRTFEEYISICRRDSPEFSAIWSDLWGEEFRHDVRVNEDGIYTDRMPDTVGEQLVKNLITEYAPPKVEAVIPRLYFFGKRKRTLVDDYSKEQKAAFEQFHRDVIQPYFEAEITEIQDRFPYAKIIIIPNGHHYCFIAQEDLVHDEMLKFLFE